jgi:hypothetical protein
MANKWYQYGLPYGMQQRQYSLESHSPQISHIHVLKSDRRPILQEQRKKASKGIEASCKITRIGFPQGLEKELVCVVYLFRAGDSKDFIRNVTGILF